MRYLTFIAMLLVAGLLPAQDGLYAPSVPEDAALVRVINATDRVITADIGPLRYRDVQPYTASAYRPLQQGVFVVGHAGAREVVTPEARSFLSVVLLPDRVAVMSDERHTDPARAQIVIYNFHSEPVSFEALRPEAVLVPEVDPGGRGQRVVNAITVTLGAVAAEILFSQELELRRGESYTLVVLDSSSEPSGFVVQAAVASE